MEVTTDKLIKADAMSSRTPKILKIMDNYETLFEKENTQQTPEEIANRLLALEKSEKGMWEN